jgi:hypothetical protein
MSTQEIAEKLVAYCREGKNIDAINELYADGIVSRESKGSPHELVEGKEGVLAKNQGWYASVAEVHGVSISDPIVTGNFFAVTMDMDVTYKDYGRMGMNEVAVYEVKDGKVVAEQFFYNM